MLVGHEDLGSFLDCGYRNSRAKGLVEVAGRLWGVLVEYVDLCGLMADYVDLS